MHDYNTRDRKTPGLDSNEPARIVLRSGRTIQATHHFVNTDGWVCAYGETTDGGIDFRIPPSTVEFIDTSDGIEGRTIRNRIRDYPSGREAIKVRSKSEGSRYEVRNDTETDACSGVFDGFEDVETAVNVVDWLTRRENSNYDVWDTENDEFVDEEVVLQ